VAEDDWAEPARQRFMDTAADLAGTGQLSHVGMKGMLTTATVVLEFVGEDGEAWHSIIDLPRSGWRDRVVHLELLRRYVQDAEEVDTADG
jgi:hypothetical protein